MLYNAVRSWNMVIKEITWQNRRDFEAILECEHCKSTEVLKSGISRRLH